jgi:single-strand DNA-binding protein
VGLLISIPNLIYICIIQHGRKMAGSVNKVILIGNLGKDPEVRRLENGTMVASFSLATSEVYTDKTTGIKKEITDWHDVVVWRGLAEIVDKYVRKGYKVYVEGKLKKRSWQDKEGQTRHITEVLADELTILSRPEGVEKAIRSVPPYAIVEETIAPSKIEELLRKDSSDLPF